jgi:transposase
MANQTISMAKIRQILRFYCQGKSKLEIASLTGVSRNTLKKYIIRFKKENLPLEQIESLTDHELEILFGNQPEPVKDKRYDDLVKLLPSLEKEIKKKGMTREELWQQYIVQYPDGYQRTRFKEYFSEFINQPSPVMHIDHKAGDKLYIDFAGAKLQIIDPELDQDTEVEVFVAILGCSQLTYVEAVYSQKKEDLIKACENALRYFGGSPQAIVPDNLKSAVTKSSKFEPHINEDFAAFAEHYGMAVIPARAYKPKDKSLVEGMVKIIYRKIYTSLGGQVHYDLASLNHAISTSLEMLNNASFKGRDYSRRQQFDEIEKTTLQPLPDYTYESKHQAVVTVMKNGHVCLSADKHYYSVPYTYIGKKIKILYNASQVDIYYRYEKIASHDRNYRKYQYTTLAQHLASAHKYLTDWTPENFIEQAYAISPAVASYISLVLEHKHHPEQAYKSCSGILGLARKVGKERLTKACSRAASYGMYNYPIVLDILDRKLDQVKEEDEHPSQNMPDHDNIRGENYYE